METKPAVTRLYWIDPKSLVRNPDGTLALPKPSQ